MLEYPQTTIVVESAPVSVVPQTVITTVEAPAAATVTYIGADPAPLPQPPTLTADQAGPSAPAAVTSPMQPVNVPVTTTNRVERVAEQDDAAGDRDEDALENPFTDEELNLVGQSVFEDITANMERFWAAYKEMDQQQSIAQDLQ